MDIRLRHFREAKGLSLRALADKAEVDWSAIHRIEQGKADPRLSTLVKLAGALEIEVVDLLTGPLKAKRFSRRGTEGV
jgi:transcriptional regulator with XRE-family HTH domain